VPYILQKDRPKIDKLVDPLALQIETEGELNYAITRLIHRVINRKGLCYATINMVMGVLSCVSRELYRRVAAPYEDEKIVENGDV